MRVGNFWVFQANDDTRGGWLAVLLYVILAILCWREVVRYYRATGIEIGSRTLPRNFWIGLALFITGLGINKQLDFQTLMIQLGREGATSAGVIDYKLWFNWVFLAGVIGGGIFLVAYLWNCFQRARFSERLVLTGTAMLGGFIFLRTAGMNHVQLVTGRMSGHRPTILLELLILIFLCCVIVQNTRSNA